MSFETERVIFQINEPEISPFSTTEGFVRKLKKTCLMEIKSNSMRPTYRNAIIRPIETKLSQNRIFPNYFFEFVLCQTVYAL